MGLFALLSCSESEEQREFERQAFQTPANITETDAQGNVSSRDEDDWRIAPMFQALIEVRPPFPNPLPISEQITFEISVTGVQSIEGIRVFELLDNGNLLELFNTVDTSSSTTFIVFTLNGQEFQNLGGGNGARGLHRIIIYDFNNNIITYGDILVQ